MFEKILNRFFSFEVYAKKEGRWQVDCICETEKEAVLRARALLQDGKSEAAKVVQQRSMLTGFTTEKVVFEENAPPVVERPPAVRDPSGDVALCERVEDLYDAISRRMVMATLKEYLAKNQITPLEVLHGWTHVRRLQDAGGLLMAAVHRTGNAQARAIGGQTRDRVNTLNRLVEKAMDDARNFMMERKRLPAFNPDLPTYIARLKEVAEPGRADFVLRAQFANWLFDHRSLVGKLEATLGLIPDPPDAGADRLIDETIADILGFGEVIQELFGNLPNLGSFLGELADVIKLEPEQPARKRDVRLTRIMALMEAGRLPETREILIQWLTKEIASDRPLDKHNPDGEAVALEKLVARLKTGDGVLGGDETLKAIAGRELRQRQILLKRAGLHGIAENLRSS